MNPYTGRTSNALLRLFPQMDICEARQVEAHIQASVMAAHEKKVKTTSYSLCGECKNGRVTRCDFIKALGFNASENVLKRMGTRYKVIEKSDGG